MLFKTSGVARAEEAVPGLRPVWKVASAQRRSALLAMALCVGMGSAGAATTLTRTNAFDYSPVTGLLIKEVVEPGDPALCLVTEHGRDATFGQKTSTTLRNCNGLAAALPGGVAESAAPGAPAAFAARTTRYVYSADRRFVTTLTNALDQTQSTVEYEPRFGLPVKSTDANGLVTAWAYDAMGRKVIEKRPDGTGTRWTYEYCVGVMVLDKPGTASCPTVNNVVGVIAVTATPVKGPIDVVAQTTGLANGPYTRVYEDALGREIRTETQGFDGSGSSQLVLQDTWYDALGRVSRKSRPYFSGATVAWTVLQYDLLDRITSVSEPSAAGTAVTTKTYNGLTVTTDDPLHHVTTRTLNLAGQLALVTDAMGGTLAQEYDPAGNLVRTTDAKGNVISIEYDLRGRKLALHDPDLGQRRYTYNAVGEVVSQLDAKGQTTSFGYDRLGRMTSRSEPSLNGSWFYDRYADGSACAFGIGSLCETRADNAHVRKHGYDSAGRRTSTTSIVGSSYTSSLAYGVDGRLATQTYPGGQQLRYDYTPLGYLQGVTDLRTNQALWTANSRDAEGRVKKATYGNGVESTNDYYVDGRLKTRQTGVGTDYKVQNLSYAYDLGGNVSTRLNLGTGVSAFYGYDALDRLTSETRSGGALAASQTIAWTYDSIGNLASRQEGGDTNTYVYPTSGQGSLRPHAVSKVSGWVNGVALPAYGYDANGNLTSGAGRTVAWTSFNKPQSLARAGHQLDYLYDAEHDRVKETYLVNGVVQRSTVYLNGPGGVGLAYEEENGAGGLKRQHYVNVLGETVALLTQQANGSWSTRYWHQDHLGSVAAVTDETRAVVERMDYEPFGKRRVADGRTDVYGTLAPAEDRGFTGHEHLDEIGLIQMNGRIYDPALGRFMSADPRLQAPNYLQSYNRYSYVFNNPLNGTDPTGYFSYTPYGSSDTSTYQSFSGSSNPSSPTMLESVTVTAPRWKGGPEATSGSAAYSVAITIPAPSPRPVIGTRDLPFGTITSFLMRRWPLGIVVLGALDFTGVVDLDATTRRHVVSVKDLHTRMDGDKEKEKALGVVEGGDGAQGGTWDVPKDAKDKIPEEWGEGEPNRKGEGRRWKDPEDEKGTGVRIDKGDPKNSQPSQQVDHVVVRDKGRVIGRSGRPIDGSIKDNPSEAHIPLSEWSKWSSWNKP